MLNRILPRLAFVFLLVFLTGLLVVLPAPSSLYAVNDLSSVFSIGTSEPPSSHLNSKPEGNSVKDDQVMDLQPAVSPLPLRTMLWKGRRQLPLAQIRALCFSVAKHLGFPPTETAQFLLEIAAAESDFGYYVRQVRGPAQSVWQIEPATARDMHERLPKRNAKLYQAIVALRDPHLSEEENVVTNLTYGAALCLGVLYLKGIRFGQLTSLAARAQAWKTKYNTYLGKGTLEGYCQKAMRYVGARLESWEAIDSALVAGPDLFSTRDSERFRTLPPNFDTSPMGQYYAVLLRKNPKVFEEIPDALLKSQTINDIATTFLWELIRKVQQDPASVRDYWDLPKALFHPLVRAALAENAIKAYPNLPPELQADEEIKAIYTAQRLLLEQLPAR